MCSGTIRCPQRLWRRRYRTGRLLGSALLVGIVSPWYNLSFWYDLTYLHALLWWNHTRPYQQARPFLMARPYQQAIYFSICQLLHSFARSSQHLCVWAVCVLCVYSNTLTCINLSLNTSLPLRSLFYTHTSQTQNTHTHTHTRINDRLIPPPPSQTHLPLGSVTARTCSLRWLPERCPSPLNRRHNCSASRSVEASSRNPEVLDFLAFLVQKYTYWLWRACLASNLINRHKASLSVLLMEPRHVLRHVTRSYKIRRNAFPHQFFDTTYFPEGLYISSL